MNEIRPSKKDRQLLESYMGKSLSGTITYNTLMLILTAILDRNPMAQYMVKSGMAGTNTGRDYEVNISSWRRFSTEGRSHSQFEALYKAIIYLLKNFWEVDDRKLD